ncbi:MAG TPA: PepSY domain-containing protein [Burkholderiales bacterium]|nr:PepSY domain-containing protein [Burkholderiales bacterium]
MNTRFRSTLGGALMLALGAASTLAVADDDRAEMEAVVKAGNFISPEEARDKALAAKPGSVIDLDLDRSWRGGYHYEVEVLDAELREWEVHVDAKTGKGVSAERDWLD